MIGLLGAHRVGKTTLARKVSEDLGIPFVETKLSDVFTMMGLNPADKLTFAERMAVQKLALGHCEQKWAAEPETFITDRTPLDFIAYTLAEVGRWNMSEAADKMVLDYISDCIKAANRFFSMVLLVQPGIQLVYEPGKAALSRAHIEHLNTIMLGLMTRRDLRAQAVVMRRDTVDFDDRRRVIFNAYKSLLRDVFKERHNSPEGALH